MKFEFWNSNCGQIKIEISDQLRLILVNFFCGDVLVPSVEKVEFKVLSRVENLIEFSKSAIHNVSVSVLCSMCSNKNIKISGSFEPTFRKKEKFFTLKMK